MKCWMCRSWNVKQTSRCKTCRDERCIECGHDLQVFIRTIDATKFRKKQWEHVLYDHRTIVKTRTFEKLCVNPACPKHWEPKTLPPWWLPVPKAKAKALTMALDDAIAEVEKKIASL